MTKKRKKKGAAPPSKPTPRPLLVKFRVDAGLTQEQLAAKLSIDKTAVSHWEHGVSFPKRSRLPDVAKQLGITVAQLLEVA